MKFGPLSTWWRRVRPLKKSNEKPRPAEQELKQTLPPKHRCVRRWIERMRQKPPITRIDRYIIWKFLGTYVFSIVLIMAIATIFDFNERIDKLTSSSATWQEIVFDYYANFIPYFANLFSPLFVFISVILFTSRLAENSEIIAMMSTGMSFKRLLRPYMISAGVIAAVTLALGAYVIPRGNVARLNFENTYLHKHVATTADNVQLLVDTSVVAYISHYENDTKTGYDFSLDKFKDKKLVAHLTARRIQYDTLSAEKYHWKITDYTTRVLHGMRERITHGAEVDSVITMEPSDFMYTRNQQETLTSPELRAFIKKQKLRGASNIVPFEVEYHKRWAMPFAAFILTVIGASLSSEKRKGGMGISMGIGLGLSFSYILFQTISSSFAVQGGWPPILAAWIPNIIFAVIAFVLYKRHPA